MRIIAAMLALVLMASTGTAQAAIVQFSGTFSGSHPAFPPGDGTMSGSFSATFDTSVVTGSGAEEFDGLPLQTLSVSDPFGFTFDTTNSGLYLRYLSGTLVDVIVGGLVGGVKGNSAPGHDFIVWYLLGLSPAPSVQRADPTAATTYAAGGSGAITITRVAEPASFALLVTAFAGAALRRRRQ